MEALESKTYTTEKTLAERMNERLAELHMTKAEAAMRMNYSRSAVSQYLNGKYASDPTEIEKKITEFLIASGDTEGIPEAPDTTEDTGVKLKSKVEFFESRDFINTIGVCQACQENIGLGIIVGKSGQGKTHALKKYAKLQRVAYIECDDTMACRDLVEAIEMELGMPRSTGGTIWSRVNRIREFFNVNQGYLLIIDEADKLINKYTQKKMEILRGIFDQSDVGIVIAGEPRLETELKSSLTRFANRMDFYYKDKFKKHLEPDIYKRAEAVLEDQYEGDVGYNPGSQMIQIAGISVLDELDHFVKEQLGIKRYLRYMDDFLLMHEDLEYLEYCKVKVIEKLAEYGFEPNPKKTKVIPITEEILFLGFYYRLTETGKIIMRLNPANVKQERKKLYRLVAKAKKGELSKAKVDECFNGWKDHAAKGTSYQLLRRMEAYYKELWRNQDGISTDQNKRL